MTGFCLIDGVLVDSGMWPSTKGTAMSAGSRLASFGQSLWLDVLSRELLASGELDRLISEHGVTGVTSNPTILERALLDSTLYDDQLAALAAAGADPRAAFEALVVDDIRAACDRLAGVHTSSAGRDGWVSLEVDPDIADDAAATVSEAVRLRDLVARPNLFIKIPATEAGVVAVEETIARGVPVNVTLIFGLARHRAIADAYVRGLERLVASGGDPRTVQSVASFFVSRVDSEADARLGRSSPLRGRLAIANARLAYAASTEVFGDVRFGALSALGARPQRCLWASTSTKDPAYRDVRYVEELIGRDTVTTMPVATLHAFEDHGVTAAALPGDIAGANESLEALARAGLDYDAVTRALEADGMRRFSDSYHRALEELKRRMTAVREHESTHQSSLA